MTHRLASAVLLRRPRVAFVYSFVASAAPQNREGIRVHVDATLLVHVRGWLRQAVRLLPGER